MFLSKFNFQRTLGSEATAKYIKDASVECGVKTIESICADGCNTMKKCGDLINDKMSFTCICHCIHNATEESLETVPQIKSVIEKAHATTLHIKNSSIRSGKLRELQKELELPNLRLQQDVKTRWWSKMNMLVRLWSNKKALLKMQEFKEWPEHLSWTEDEFDLIHGLFEVLFIYLFIY